MVLPIHSQQIINMTQSQVHQHFFEYYQVQCFFYQFYFTNICPVFSAKLYAIRPVNVQYFFKLLSKTLIMFIITNYLILILQKSTQ